MCASTRWDRDFSFPQKREGCRFSFLFFFLFRFVCVCVCVELCGVSGDQNFRISKFWTIMLCDAPEDSCSAPPCVLNYGEGLDNDGLHASIEHNHFILQHFIGGSNRHNTALYHCFVGFTAAYDNSTPRRLLRECLQRNGVRG